MTRLLPTLLLALIACAKHAPQAAAPEPPKPHVILAAGPPATMQWITPLTGASYGLVMTFGGGILYEAHCVTQVIQSSETLYVFFIDRNNPSQPSNGTAAINGGVSGGMTAVGQDVSFSDQTNPAMPFTLGLMMAASTTPDTYTAPNASDQIRCDAKIRAY